jgi:hypothetical protein
MKRERKNTHSLKRPVDLSVQKPPEIKWPKVYVLPSCTCDAHPFAHYHPTMKWTEDASDVRQVQAAKERN